MTYKKKLLNIRENPLYLLTDTNISGLSHIQIVRKAVRAGIRTIQLREKNISRKELHKIAAAVRDVTERYNVIFIMNDYVDIALSVNADGIHLGQDDMPLEEARKLMGNRKLIGISTHSLKQAMKAEEGGADYIGFGPLYNTLTKDAGHAKGVKTLRHIRLHIDIPIVAIGGITWKNVNEVVQSGADAVAVASGILAGNMKQNVNRFLEAVRNKK